MGKREKALQSSRSGEPSFCICMSANFRQRFCHPEDHTVLSHHIFLGRDGFAIIVRPVNAQDNAIVSHGNLECCIHNHICHMVDPIVLHNLHIPDNGIIGAVEADSIQLRGVSGILQALVIIPCACSEPVAISAGRFAVKDIVDAGKPPLIAVLGRMGFIRRDNPVIFHAYLSGNRNGRILRSKGNIVVLGVFLHKRNGGSIQGSGQRISYCLAAHLTHRPGLVGSFPQSMLQGFAFGSTALRAGLGS